MPDRPLIMSAPMMRALLDGRKTQTRRVLRWQPDPVADYATGPFQNADGVWGQTIWEPGNVERFCPLRLPYAVGDRLWVREACGRRPAMTLFGEPAKNGIEEAFYLADDGPVLNPHTFNLCPWWKGKTGSPMLMLRTASRLTLIVTDVRVQRVKDISEEDALAEGVETDVWDMAPVAKRYGTDGWFVGWPDCTSGPSVSVDMEEVCRKSYASLWNSLHGPDAWEQNPWVAAVTFECVTANIDTPPPARPGATTETR